MKQINNYIVMGFILLGVILLFSLFVDSILGEKDEINPKIDEVGLSGQPDFRY